MIVQVYNVENKKYEVGQSYLLNDLEIGHVIEPKNKNGYMTLGVQDTYYQMLKNYIENFSVTQKIKNIG